MSRAMCFKRIAGFGMVFAFVVSAASAGDLEVIYTKLAGHAKANIPGTLDLAGMPAASDWRAIEDFSVSPNGRQWMIKGRTQLGSDLETILVLGSGNSGSMFAQEGQPFQGAAAGELYDFFDSLSPVSFDTLGGMAFSARARGGSTADNEKLIYVDPNGVHTQILQQGDPALGLIDTGTSGDELFGNSIGSVQVLETADLVQFVNTPITNLSSFRYPAMFRSNTSFRQSGVSMIDGEIWDSFDLSDAGGTPDGAHWFAEGDTENPDTNVDDILAVDDTVVIRQGSPVAGTGTPLMADIFNTRMAANGSWISRGDDPADDDWVVMDGTLIAKTGDPIITGSSEHWSAVFLAINNNSLGDWIIVGETDNADASLNTVLVLNGTHVLAREGDPVDLDGNGSFDDDAFIGRGTPTLSAFAANDAALTDRRVVYFTANLHDEAGNDLQSSPSFGTPDAFMRVQFCHGDINRDEVIDLTDLAMLLSLFDLCDGDVGFNPLADLDDSGCVDLTDLALMLSNFENPC